jgi:excisionase family DNA binding protein
VDIVEEYRKTELRLRLLLFGDGADIPPIVKGEIPRQRVLNEIKHLRTAFDALLEKEHVSRDEVVEAARALESELSKVASLRAEVQAASGPPRLVTPAEAAEVLGLSTSSVYRAVRKGSLRPATPAGEPMRLSHADVLRYRETAHIATA